jgi:hypothetical protein
VPRDASLPPASSQTRQTVGIALVGLLVLAVALAAAAAPVAVRAPVVLLAATFGPGYPLVARLPLDLATLLGLAAVTSLAIEAGAAFVLVQLELWHPQVLGLALATLAAGATLALVQQLRLVPDGSG